MAIRVQGNVVIDDSRNINTGTGIITTTTLNVGSGASAVTINGTTGIISATTVRVGSGASTVIIDGSTGIISATTVRVGSGASTVIIDGSTGIISATSLTLGTQTVSSPGVGIATAGGTVGTGATILDFRGAGISTVTVSAGIATINITGGGGGSASGVSDGVVFNAGITSITTARLTGTGSTVLTLPATAGKEYILYSINAANVAAGNSEVNVIGAFDFNGGERSYFAYNIPVPTGTSIELLKQPQVLNPSDRIVMRSTDINRAGDDNAVDVYISYQEKTSTAYFGIGVGVSGITTTAPIGIYTSTSSGSVLQSIRLTNITDVGGYPVSITVTSGVTTTFLVDDLVVPKYASVEILDAPKTLKTNDVISITVDQIDTINVQISGIKV
jgi:hypothetical protein